MSDRIKSNTSVTASVDSTPFGISPATASCGATGCVAVTPQLMSPAELETDRTQASAIAAQKRLKHLIGLSPSRLVSYYCPGKNPCERRKLDQLSKFLASLKM